MQDMPDLWRETGRPVGLEAGPWAARLNADVNGMVYKEWYEDLPSTPLCNEIKATGARLLQNERPWHGVDAARCAVEVGMKDFAMYLLLTPKWMFWRRFFLHAQLRRAERVYEAMKEVHPKG